MQLRTPSISFLPALALVTFLSSGAGAAVEPVEQTPERTTGEIHSFDPDRQYWITYADCMADDELVFDVTLQNDTGNLQVWATTEGGKCTSSSEQSTVEGSCWLVYEANAQNFQTIHVRTQDIASMKYGRAALGKGTEASCNQTLVSTTGVNITLSFMLSTGTANADYVGSFEKTGLDLLGPPAPEITGEPGIKDGRLGLSWSVSDADDWAGYRIYCYPDPSSGATETAELRPLAAPEAGGAGSVGLAQAGTAGASATGGTSTTGGASATGGASTGTAGAAGSGTTTEQSSGTIAPGCRFEGGLVPGEIPDERYLCGSELENQLAREGDAKSYDGEPLANGTTYQLAVAGTDLFGNPGKISSVVCGTPHDVTTFYEAYRDAGGKAGGGFCAFSPRRSLSSLAWLGGAALLLALRQRRRRR